MNQKTQIHKSLAYAYNTAWYFMNTHTFNLKICETHLCVEIWRKGNRIGFIDVEEK